MLTANVASFKSSEATKRQHSGFKFLDVSQISTSKLLGIAVVLFAARLVIFSPGFLGIGIIAAATVFAWFQFQKLTGFWRSISRAVVLACAACLTAMWSTTFVEPANAQLLFQAEEFFKEKLFGAVGGSGLTLADTTIGVVFACMRALYILYLAVAIIGVVNAVRQDEDWQTAARTPLLIFVCVTAADMLTQFIVGTTY
jgi:energy-coupling factor transporter transmembrane protein EcfT